MFILGEAVVMYLGITLVSFTLMREEVSFFFLLESWWWRILLVTLVTQLSIYFNDLYELRPIGNMREVAIRLVQSLGITYIALAIICYLWPEAMLGEWVFIVSILFGFFFIVPWRFSYAYVVKQKLFSEKTLIVGDGELARDLLNEIGSRRDIGYDVRLVVGQENGDHSKSHFEDAPIRYGFDKLCDLAQAQQASTIIVALDQKRGIMPYNELLKCKMKRFSIIDGESFYERITGKLLIERIKPSWLIFSEGFVKSPVAKFVKRLIGLVLSSIMLTLLSPLMLIVSIAIKLDSKGPVFFSQKRVGEGEKIFEIHKFRSMIGDAEGECGPVWAEENDARITRVGRFIRKVHIDELPQFWNVLKGDMSIVGPRPERPYFVEKLKTNIPYYTLRFGVKPGVTGWAQINYRYGATEKEAFEKLRYDLYYIKNMSLIMDLMVILHTVKTVLLRRGSR